MNANDRHTEVPTAATDPQESLVVFTPSGKRGHFKNGTSVLDAARSLGVDIDSVCGGRGLCGRCQIVPGDGDFAKHGIVSSDSHLSEGTRAEARYQRINGAFSKGRRLGCQAKVRGDLVVDVPADSQVHRQLVRKDAEVIDLVLAPATRLHVVDVREPDMHEPSSDLGRVREALEREHGLNNLQVHPSVLPTLQKTLRAGDWRVTVAVHDAQQIMGIWPGYKERVAGLAVDVGSTTIAAHLCDLVTGDVLASSGAMNPQIRFGEDLMSRVSYVMMNPGGDQQMTSAVREAINGLVGDVVEGASLTRDDVMECTLVANPVMHHLLLGIDPVELGGAPFALAVDEPIALDATALDLEMHPAARCWILPCVAGHVGADTAGVVLAEGPEQGDAISLLVDVGTNAEIVLGNSERLLACSSPTGPAFEGAQISGGQRAAPGAIERVRIDRETLEPRFSIIGSELWSDQAGFEAATHATGVTGICGSGIIEVVAELFLAGVIDSEGTIRGELAARNPRIVEDGRTFSYVLCGPVAPGTSPDLAANDPDLDASHATEISIRITQNDVRQIQLAKAALYAGVRLLMDRLGIDKIDRIRLAGAFGSHIDVTYAMVLGLIPDCALDAVGSAGNAAGIGARIALLDVQARQRITELVGRIEKIETAVEPDFQAHFVEAMAFPHKTAEFPELAKQVDLPARVAANAANPRRRRRRDSRRVRT